MAKKRSKQEKLKAQQLRQAKLKNRVPSDSSKLASAKSAAPEAVKSAAPVKASGFNRQLFAYDPKLILSDLRKTLVVTLIILLVLAFLALRYT